MSVPTEPGWYWWRHPRYRNGKWTITRVRAAHAGVGLMHSPWGGSICHSWRAVPGEGEWGERIPDNDTLKAMREILAEGPWVHHQQDAPWCIICHADSPTHDPDCPWLRAQETQDADDILRKEFTDDEILSKALALLHAAPTMYRACCAAFQALNQRVRLPNVDADALSLLHRVRRETELLGWGAEDEEAPTPPRARSHMEAVCEQLAERAVKDAEGPPVYIQCPVCHAIGRVGPGTLLHVSNCTVAPRHHPGPAGEKKAPARQCPACGNPDYRISEPCPACGYTAFFN